MYSMTAYSCAVLEGEWGRLAWECRSVNHRYFDLTLRMPEMFHYLENQLRESAKILLRGKVDCSLTFKPSAACGQQRLIFNLERAKHLIDASKKINELIDVPSFFDLAAFLARSDVWEKEEMDVSLVEKPALSLFAQALSEMVAFRLKEGGFLKREMHERTLEMKQHLSLVREYLPLILSGQKSKIMLRLEEIKGNIDVHRLEQEMVYLMQKMDVSEEVDRLFIHLNEVQGILNESDRPVGRRLDFLMQELNREVNTIGSKISGGEITRVVVDLKVLIEQIREQVQNIV